MNIESLKIFCKVVEEGSLSKVARILYISQPAVTKQIQQLECYYMIELFNRTEGKLLLNEAGDLLYQHAKEIIEMDKDAKKAIKQLINNNETTLAIGASLTIGEYLLPKVLGQYQKKHNNIKFSLSIGSTPIIISKLENNEIDIAFIEGITHHKKFKTEKISEDELILVIPNDHPWNKKAKIDITEIPSEKMIWRERGSGARDIIENILKEFNVLNKIKSRMEMGSTQAIKSAVEAGMGIAILPKLSVLKELNLGSLRELKISEVHMKRDYFIVRKPLRFPNKNLDDVINYIKKTRIS